MVPAAEGSVELLGKRRESVDALTATAEEVVGLAPVDLETPATWGDSEAPEEGVEWAKVDWAKVAGKKREAGSGKT